jgi:hypothetical protein
LITIQEAMSGRTPATPRGYRQHPSAESFKLKIAYLKSSVDAACAGHKFASRARI